MKARGTTLVVAAALLAASGSAGAADQPPRDLHLVGDHWTAWDPPAPPPGAEVHVIERGDTLWDLAARFYGDPYLWPQLWEQNGYILDAHWIYPGDPLVLGVEVETVTTLADGSLAGEGAGAGAEAGDGAGGPGYISAAEAAGPPGPLGAESDIFCTGFVGEMDEAFPYRIAGSEWQALVPDLKHLGGTARLSYRGKYGSDTLKYSLMNGDIVYLDGGYEGGMEPGQVLTAVAAGDRVRHPITGDVFGRHYGYLGRVRVLSVQATTAIAEIVHTCDPLMVGALLQPFVPEPVPLGRRTGPKPLNLPPPVEELVNGPVILLAEDRVLTLGEDSVVYLDRGENFDLVPGDIYTIYRLNQEGLPPVLLGELAVLSVHPRSSVARIIRSRQTIYPGDRLELK